MSSRILLSYLLCLSAFSFAACENGGAPPTTNSAAKPEPAKPTETTKPSAPAKPEAVKAEPAKVEAPKTEAPKSDAPAAAAAADPAIEKMREFCTSLKIDKTVGGWRTMVKEPPKLTFDPARKYFWLLDTSEGAIKILFKPDVAPMHVSSAIYLTELGFYDDLTFHRVIPGFMAQGGDPVGNGSGGPDYRLMAETSPAAKHDKAGVVSTANTGQPKSDGSQFFITFGPTPALDGGYTVFGEVTEGLENLKKLEMFGSASGKTTKLLKIVTAKILTE